MKSFVFLLATLGILLGLCSASIQSECSLSAEIMPLEYVFVTRSVSFRMRFTSNCLRLRDFTFEGFFSFRNRLSKQAHPVMIDLAVFGNNYRLFFGKQAEKNQKSILRKYVYNEVKLSPSERQSGLIRTDTNNQIILDQQINNSYNYESLKKLLYMSNPVTCAIQKGNKGMKCTIK